MDNLETIAVLVIYCGLPLGAIYGLLRWYQHWLSLPRPGDIPQIKGELETNEHRVINIQPAGFERGSIFSRHYYPSYRKYRVTVRSPLGGPDEVHLVGVQAGLLAYRKLREYERARHMDFDGPRS